jgi:pimeloyl-ACP methyl ester carboxylesterase
MTLTRHHTLPDGRQIAFRHTPGPSGNGGTTLVFLPGYMSDMAGSKAQAVFDWAVANNQACLLLDYSGCGESSGEFKDGSLSRWRDEVLELVEAHCPGPVVLIGSSMGGWLMLLAGLALGDKLAGLIGIAPAPDFTAWGYSDEQQAELLAGETVFEENAYGPQPTPTYPLFWADGETHLLTNREIPITCPVRLLQGQSDPDVPWEISLQLASDLRSDDVQVMLIKDGDHRLSRPADIALLLRAVAELANRA